jgi:hypothetical protein
MEDLLDIRVLSFVISCYNKRAYSHFMYIGEKKLHVPYSVTSHFWKKSEVTFRFRLIFRIEVISVIVVY